ncbi:MAG: hypothetical protein RLY86_259 [Pseudomonadota bacterium]|jgi:Uma2 family endonuclease
MNALPVAKPRRMTVGEFLDWPGDGTDTRYDLIAGEPVAQAAPSRQHSEIQASLTGLLFTALRDRPPCRPLTEAGVFRSRRHFNYRTADLLVTCRPPNALDPVEPRIVFEILSPSNRRQTLANIGFYAAFDSVQEIVTVDSERVEILVYRRETGPDWSDTPAAVLGPGDRLVLHSIDVTLDLADIYRNVPF